MPHTSSPVIQNESVSIDRYVSQLENRIQEQAQLIKLLNEKIANLESGTDASPKFSDVVKGTPTGDASTSGRTAGGGNKSRSAFLVIGSKKSDISCVPTVRYFQLFVTRIDPSTSPRKLAESLMTAAPELSSVVCSKMVTKHNSYASFHVVVLEVEKPLICSNDVWPEGSLVKQFHGKLLKTHVLDVFNSVKPDEVFSKVSDSGAKGVSESNVVNEGSGSSASKCKAQARSGAGGVNTKPLPAGLTLGNRGKSPAAPASTTSPKNLRARSIVKNT